MPAPSDTRAANQILDIEAGGGVLDIEAGDMSTSFFVCSISFVLFRLFFFCWSLPTDGADCRGSYGVSPTTPPIETAPTIGSRVNQLSAFSRAREGSGHHDLASRASRRCRRRATRARRLKFSISRPAVVCSISRPAICRPPFSFVLFRLFYFVCSISFVLFLLVAAD